MSGFVNILKCPFHHPKINFFNVKSFLVKNIFWRFGKNSTFLLLIFVAQESNKKILLILKVIFAPMQK
jgi:uncharacterized membrane protein